MKDRALIFSAPMVLALLREVEKPGTGKRMTRRLAWKPWTEADLDHYEAVRIPEMTIDRRGMPTQWQHVKPGDRLWVKEAIEFSSDHLSFWYAADKTCLLDSVSMRLREREVERGKPYKNLGGRYVPRFTSRLTLIVTATKIERLQEISEEDARAEGCAYYVPGHGWITEDELRGDPGYSNFLSGRMGFEDIWCTLHGKESWTANPEVVAITGTVHKQNIDKMPMQEAA
jgi:hypothetical protein